jgi:iron complex outermembrane receptor protein
MFSSSKRAVLATASVLTIIIAAGPAGAQVTASASPDTTPQDTVTVTGSRIVRNGYSAPTPVTVATVADLLETTPTNIADALNKLPEFSPQFTPQSNTGAAAPGGNYLNLRGLGQNRTLVLLDGVRVPATNTTGTADTNTLPQALVQRVEVVTGGASAIYGSDAVGGVVNYILNTKFNGLKGSVQAGISTYGDAPSEKISLAFGAHVLNNGHFEVSYEHSQSTGINQADRSETANQPGYAGAGTLASPYILYDNLRMATTTRGGYVYGATGATPAQTAALSAAIVNQQFVGTGTLAPFNAGAATPTLANATTNTGGLQVGGDGAYVTGGQLVKPVNTDNLFARFDYDLGHNVTAFAQVAAGLSQSNYLIQPAALSTTVISGNAFLPANVQTAMAAASTPAKPATFTMASLPQNLFQMQQTHAWDSDLSATFGLKGKVLNDVYSWNLAYNHGQGLNHIESDNSINTSHFYAALDAVKDPSGNIVCNVSLTSSASLYPGCVPLNLLGQGNESAAALAYIMQNTAYTIINKTDDLSGSLSGTAFDDWAGPVSVSANFDYRRVSLAETTDSQPAAPQLTGLRQTWVTSGLKGAAPSTLYLNNTVSAMSGSNSVWEVGGETVVPLLKDFPLVKNLEFSGALRYTQYSISGPAITWKAGLSYQPIDDLRIRATESRDIRAPTLYELFQAPAVSSVSVTDPLLNNAVYTVNQYTQGNTQVKPEVATTNTLGVIYSPSWFPRFRISVDYYLINIENALSNSLPSLNSVTSDINACDASGGTSVYCQAVPRPLPLSNTTSANQITAVYGFPINVAEQYTRGVDFEASYAFDMRDIRSSWVGQTDLRVLATYSPTNVTIASPGAPAAGSPLSAPLVTRVSATVNYNLGPFKASLLTSYTDKHRIALPSLTPTYYVEPILAATVTEDLNLSYRFKADGHDLQAFFNVTNLFNELPLVAPTAPTGTPGNQTPLSSSISPLGRYFTAGVRFTY